MLTNKAAGGWERVVLADQTDRVGVSSLFHKRHIARDVHMGRTDRDNGRIMSRKEALDSLSMEQYTEEMEGIFTTCVNRGTLDEAPMTQV